MIANVHICWQKRVFCDLPRSPLQISLWFISSSFVSVCKHTTMSSSLSPLLAECHFWAIKFPELLLHIACDTCPTLAPTACREMAREWAKAHPHATSESQPAAGMPRSLQKCCEFGRPKIEEFYPRKNSVFWGGKGIWMCLRQTKMPGFLEGVWSCSGQVLPRSSLSAHQGCVLSGQWPGAFLKAQVPTLHFCCLCGQVHLSIQSSDCPFAVLVTLWWGFWMHWHWGTECKWQSASQILGHPVGTDPAWTVTLSGESNLNHPFLCRSWALRSQILALPFSPDTAAF